MASKRGRNKSTISSKRVTRNKSKLSTKISSQLCMNVIDKCSTISTSKGQHFINHFGSAWFPLQITVSPKCSDLEPQPIAIQLLFEDGEQVNGDNNINNNNKKNKNKSKKNESNRNNVIFKTNPSSLKLVNGSCSFNVRIDSYSMWHDNRAFKFYFSLGENATRHIRPCETNPFRLVKHRLEIVNEPEDTFYKDEGGRANCLRCRILLKDSSSNTVINRDIPLTAKLIYEDMTAAQSSRDILEILTQNVELKQGQSNVKFRINEVSKNHNKRAFRVLFECKSSDALYHDISSCVSCPVIVKSKRTKRKVKTDDMIITNHHRSSGRKKKPIKKRKRSSATKKKHHSPSYCSSTDNDDELESFNDDSSDNQLENGINIEPVRKRPRRNNYNNNNLNIINNNLNYHEPPHLSSTLPPSHTDNNHNANGVNIINQDNIHYVPPAITGILPSIQPGSLPRIGHNPPPFINVSKKNGIKTENINGNGVVNGDNNNEVAVDNNNGDTGNTDNSLLGRMFSWCKLAGWVMLKLEWTPCGFEYDEATHSIDTSRPLYRCSYCLKYRNISGWGQHEEWCQLKIALNEYKTKVKLSCNEWNYQKSSIDINGGDGMTSLEQNEPNCPQKEKEKEKNLNGNENNNSNNNTNVIWNDQYMNNVNHLNINQIPFNNNLNPKVQSPVQNDKAIKSEMNNNNNESSINLPTGMCRIASVSRVPSTQTGYYGAYDKNNEILGYFDDSAAFLDVDQFDHENNLNNNILPPFDSNNMLIRNQSDDFYFYGQIKNSIYDDINNK